MSTKSSRNLQIDLSTVEIKRQLDSEILKTASFVRDGTVSDDLNFDAVSNHNDNYWIFAGNNTIAIIVHAIWRQGT